MNICGIIINYVGAFLIAKSIFLFIGAYQFLGTKEEYKKIPKSYKFIIRKLLGINETNWYKVFCDDFIKNKKEEKKFRDHYAPIRGLIWIVFGSLFQIVSNLLKS